MTAGAPAAVCSHHPKTLFHLILKNPPAADALRHPDNKRYVSLVYNSDAETGLEIGFHVPSTPSGRVITRLGRRGDIILQGRTISSIHVAFEINPTSHAMLLCVRAKNASSVKIARRNDSKNKGIAGQGGGTNVAQTLVEENYAEPFVGDCAIVYGREYLIDIGLYQFKLVWARPVSGEEDVKRLQAKVLEQYEDSLKRAGEINSRFLPTEIDESQQSWYNTRIQTAKSLAIQELDRNSRVIIGNGGFGAVFHTLEKVSGNAIAVKAVKIPPGREGQNIQRMLHREIKCLEELKHPHIIDLLAVEGWNTNRVEIFMPLRDGSLKRFVERRSDDNRILCREVLFQVLQALDFLASYKLCHRDVKPENILYTELGQGRYLYELADFGLANHASLAKTFCGTWKYMAPEIFQPNNEDAQSPKMDVWSLFVTIIELHGSFGFPPPECDTYGKIHAAVLKSATLESNLAPMAREIPEERASAAQMLIKLFNGAGLTSKRVEPLGLEKATPQSGKMASSKKKVKHTASIVDISVVESKPGPLTYQLDTNQPDIATQNMIPPRQQPADWGKEKEGDSPAFKGEGARPRRTRRGVRGEDQLDALKPRCQGVQKRRHGRERTNEMNALYGFHPMDID